MGAKCDHFKLGVRTLIWMCEVRTCDPKNGRNSHLGNWQSLCELSYLAFLLCRCLGERGRTLIKSMLGTKCIFWVSRCSSFFTWRFLNILGCSGPLCAVRPYYLQFAQSYYVVVVVQKVYQASLSIAFCNCKSRLEGAIVDIF